jgi:uncharacterized protein (TIGR02444 family)
MPVMDESGSAFWRFSLRFYRRPDVPALCLALQDDHGVDVNLLFFINFLAINGRRLNADEVRVIDAQGSAWRRLVVQPLRTLRRQLKSGITPVPTAASQALRSAIQQNELHAERLQQEALESAFPVATTGTAAAPRVAAAANLTAYSALTGPLPEATIQTLLAALYEEFSV